MMPFHPDRRGVLAGLGAFAGGRPKAAAQEGTADIILFNGRITTLDRQNPQAQAIAIRGERFAAAGTEQEVGGFLLVAWHDLKCLAAFKERRSFAHDQTHLEQKERA
jgi:hypothetical protein